MMCDKHVIKMVLETTQLLCTAHRLLDGWEWIENKYVPGSLPARYRKIKRWRLDDNMDKCLYQATHVNHPSAVWVRVSRSNYTWTHNHLCALHDEYTHRYGKIHKCREVLVMLARPPRNISEGIFTPPTQAMPDEYKDADAVTAYRNYYRGGKKHLFSWKNREQPKWI